MIGGHVAAQRTDKAPASSKAYILTSILPEKYRVQDVILVPPKVPTSQTEATYVGLYSLIVSLVYLCGGQIAEARLDRYLQRMNAEPYTPLDKTDKLLQRLCKEGYLVKIKDSSSGEEMVEYMVGPRGKAEVGPKGAAGLVKTVYADSAVDDLDARVQRSLGIEDRRGRNSTNNNNDEDEQEGEAGATEEASNGPQPTRRRSTRKRTRQQDDDEEDEDEGAAANEGSDQDSDSEDE